MDSTMNWVSVFWKNKEGENEKWEQVKWGRKEISLMWSKQRMTGSTVTVSLLFFLLIFSSLCFRHLIPFLIFSSFHSTDPLTLSLFNNSRTPSPHTHLTLTHLKIRTQEWGDVDQTLFFVTKKWENNRTGESKDRHKRSGRRDNGKLLFRTAGLWGSRHRRESFDKRCSIIHFSLFPKVS